MADLLDHWAGSSLRVTASVVGGMSGHFRLRIGTTFTQLLSYQATEKKILYELEKLKEVGHVSFIGSRAHTSYDAIRF